MKLVIKMFVVIVIGVVVLSFLFVVFFVESVNFFGV